MVRALSRHPEVFSDLRKIGLYIAQDNPRAAEQIILEAEELFEVLREFPFLGFSLSAFQIQGISDLRTIGVPDFKRYVVFYGVSKSEIRVLYVFSRFQNIPAQIDSDQRM